MTAHDDSKKRSLMEYCAKNYGRLNDLEKAWLNGWISGKLDNHENMPAPQGEDKKAG